MNIQKIGLALAFSPSMEALMAETVRFLRLFQSQLVLVHVGKETEQARLLVSELLKKNQLGSEHVKVVWKEGDPADCILKACKEEGVDLLIAGALRKENLMKHYLGTVARKILRKADCSVLMLITPSTQAKPYKQVVVNAEDSQFVEDALSAACEVGRKNNVSWVHIVREVKLYGLTMSAMDDRTADEYVEFRNGLMRTEIENVEKLLAKVNHENLKINIKLLSGKSGFELARFAERKNADLLVVGTPPRKFFFIDRVFTHDLEYIFQDLPCNLLIVNPKKGKEASRG